MDIIPVTLQNVARNYWNELWAQPLSTSYPASNFQVTAGTQNDAPGSPNFQNIFSPGGSQAGDPRTTASPGFFEIFSGNSGQSLRDAMGAPSLTGGSTYTVNAPSTVPPGAGIPMIVIILFVGVVVWFVIKRF